MVGFKQIERRRFVGRALRLGQPLFMEVSKASASLILAAATIVSILLVRFATTSIEPGSLFLLICALAAWFVGNRFATLLGIFIVVVQYLNRQIIDLQNAKVDEVIDFAFQLSCSAAVVFMLGIARVALELEWRLARIDPLTGALNRKAFFEVIGAETCSNDLAVLIFADLDGLKRLNDQFGHKKGDEALSNFADCVKKSIRKHDIFARIGGDEFIIYLYVRDVAGAQSVVRRLHSEINIQPQTKSELKCSLGALLLPTGSHAIDSELRHADSLMYDAKRNQTGYSIAIQTEPDQTKLVQIASGINAHDLIDAKARSRSRYAKDSEAVGSAVNPLAA